MIEALALLAFFGMLIYHALDSLKRFRRVKFTRKGLRRMCQRRYRRGCRTRQQVRALQHVAWQMRADGSPAPKPVLCMTTVPLLPWFDLKKHAVPVVDGRRGLAGLISQQPTEPVLR